MLRKIIEKIIMKIAPSTDWMDRHYVRLYDTPERPPKNTAIGTTNTKQPKYQFESKYEIEKCKHCPIRLYDEFEDLYCGIAWKTPKGCENGRPEWCPLIRVEEVLEDRNTDTCPHGHEWDDCPDCRH